MVDGEVVKSKLREMKCHHNEADMMLVFYANCVGNWILHQPMRVVKSWCETSQIGLIYNLHCTPIYIDTYRIGYYEFP